MKNLVMKKSQQFDIAPQQLYALFGLEQLLNSRSKDLYDIYFLTKVNQNIDYDKISESVRTTFKQREPFTGVLVDSNNYLSILDFLSKSAQQNDFWDRFQRQNKYARELSFDEVMNAVIAFGQQIVRHSVI
jgi:hypothetical protein